MISGHDTAMQEDTRKMVITDIKIKEKILAIWKDWKELERISRRPDRASKTSFQKRQERFLVEVLDMPLNISRGDFETILKEDSGITDWKEDVKHLQNQLQKDQKGTCKGLDLKQKKIDDKKIDAKIVLDIKNSIMDDIEEVDYGVQDDDDDDDFVVQEKKKKKRKIDVMGPVTATADRLGLSVIQRCMFAASVTNTIGINLDDTNINRGSALRKAQEERIKIADSTRENFKVPDMIVTHHDGKIMKTKGNRLSNRVCVYITGVDNTGTKKLLGVPETKDGTGAAEADVVKGQLIKWNIGKEVVGMVFDTTSSNTGAENGACRYLEDWLENPIFWLGCRHHVHELHVKRVVQEVTGLTKDPGVTIFRRLKSEWYKIEIDYNNLSKFDYTSVPAWMQEEGAAVLAWAEQELGKNTWPRADYRELLELTIVCLGGEVPGFEFHLPGPDHHARWMSKNIYFLKLKLLSSNKQRKSALSS